jgi:hypothetical protein
MSEKELEELVEKNMSAKIVSTATGLKAVEKLKEIAKREGVKFAVIGGLAMHLYGFDRATKDVDFIAERRLSLEVKRYLTFGGERYEIEVEGEKIPVDWIIRRDQYKEFYKLAFAESEELSRGFRIITPEWLVILKYIAGRPKDEIDLLWLLQQPGLVKRRLVRKKIMQVVGAMQGDLIFREIERRYFYLATKKNNGDEKYPNYNE